MGDRLTLERLEEDKRLMLERLEEAKRLMQEHALVEQPPILLSAHLARLLADGLGITLDWAPKHGDVLEIAGLKVHVDDQVPEGKVYLLSDQTWPPEVPQPPYPVMRINVPGVLKTVIDT